MSGAPRLGVAISGHWLTLLEIQSVVQTVDALRCFEVLFVDGDATQISRRPAAPIYEAGVLMAAALSWSQWVRVGAIRLPGFTHPALLARQLATLQETSQGRALGFFGAGAGRSLQALGLPALPARDRVAYLDEVLPVVRRLLRGGPVDFAGRFVQLRGVTAPVPRTPVPIVVAAAGRRMLDLVEAHADVWDVNTPPLPRCIEPLRKHLDRPVPAWIWVFARPGAQPNEAYAEYRRLCPWFPELEAEERNSALLFGKPAGWWERARQLQATLGVDLIVLDLMGLDAITACRALREFGTAKAGGMA